MANPYCEACKHEHGPLYICESYSEERKAEIRMAEATFLANLQDPAWIRSEVEKGTPPEVIAILRAMAGI